MPAGTTTEEPVAMLRMTVKHSVFSSRASFMMPRVTHSRLDEGPKVRVMKPFMPVKSRPSGNERM